MTTVGLASPSSSPARTTSTSGLKTSAGPKLRRATSRPFTLTVAVRSGLSSWVSSEYWLSAYSAKAVSRVEVQRSRLRRSNIHLTRSPKASRLGSISQVAESTAAAVSTSEHRRCRRDTSPKPPSASLRSQTSARTWSASADSPSSWSARASMAAPQALSHFRRFPPSWPRNRPAISVADAGAPARADTKAMYACVSWSPAVTSRLTRPRAAVADFHMRLLTVNPASRASVSPKTTYAVIHGLDLSCSHQPQPPCSFCMPWSRSSPDSTIFGSSFSRAGFSTSSWSSIRFTTMSGRNEDIVCSTQPYG